MSFNWLDDVIFDLKKINEIKSIYLYGSALVKKEFNDVDLLIICSEEKQLSVVKKIKKIKTKFSNKIKLDINICFYNEFKLEIHVNRPPTYFLGIALQNKLLFGEDLLKKFKTKKISIKKIYERVVNLAQSARALFISEKEKNSDFWVKYQRRWLIISFLEVLYLQGVFELDKEKGLKKFIRKNDSPKKILNLLNEKKTDVKLLFESSEWLRQFMLKNFKF